MDLLWAVLAVVVVAGLIWLDSRLKPDRRQRTQTAQQRLDEAEILTHSKRPFP